MIFIFSIFLFVVNFLCLLDVVLKFRNLPIYGALPVAFAFFVALESIILNSLSVFKAVNASGVILAHIVFLTVWIIWSYRKNRIKCIVRIVYRTILMFSSFWKNSKYRILIPTIVILGLTAFIYPPNNWDSMTYHMARVAHWIQNGSVGYYETAIDRQNIMGPGAEYIIIFFQVLTHSDIFANVVQLSSFIILILSAKYLVRIIGIPERLSPYLIVISVITPMALLQATSTQNDLVAAVMTFAIIISFGRLYSGQFKRMNRNEFMIAGISVGSAFLVKPTSIIIAAPLILLGIILQSGKILKQPKILNKLIVDIFVFILMFIIVAGPDIIRKGSEVYSRGEVYLYPVFSQWTSDRLWNPIRTVGQNTPFPEKTKLILGNIGYSDDLCSNNVFSNHEDLVGNPIQFLVIFFTGFVSIILFPFFVGKRKYRRLILLSLYPFAAWVLFALVVKNNAWITRLQLPIFFLLPFSFAFLSVIAEKKKVSRLILSWSIKIVFILSLSYGFVVVTQNRSRPISLAHFFGNIPSRESSYYNNRNMKASHDYLLETAKAVKCSRIGLIIGGDSYDYPLSWRAMQQNIQTRHMSTKSDWDWPCLLYAEKNCQENILKKGQLWLPIVGDSQTFYKNIRYRFSVSKNKSLLINHNNGFSDIDGIHEVSILSHPNGIVLKSNGEDPQVLLPQFTFPYNKPIIIKIIISSSKNTILQLFYSTKSNPVYTEEQSKKKAIKVGYNEIYIELGPRCYNGRLRLDPGKTDGDFILHSFEVRS